MLIIIRTGQKINGIQKKLESAGYKCIARLGDAVLKLDASKAEIEAALPKRLLKHLSIHKDNDTSLLEGELAHPGLKILLSPGAD